MRPPPRIPSWIVVPSLVLAAWIVGHRCVGNWPLDVHLRDDAYYYFCWARSLAGGEGPCVTPGVPTSGVHVLWALLLTAVGFVGGSAILPAASVILGLVLHVATAALVYRAAFPRRSVGLVLASAYAGAPFLATEAMNGQETALGCFALAVFLIFHDRGPRAFGWAGLLAVLARSDLILVVAAMALAEPRARAARIVVTLLIFAVYAGVNYLLAGHWLQDSAEPIPWLIEQEFDTAFGARMDLIGEHTMIIFLGTPFRLSSTPMAVAWLLAVWFGLKRRDSRFAWLLIGALALVSLHYYGRFYPRDYYFAPLGVAATLATWRLCQLRPGLGLALLLLAVVWNGYRFVRHPAPSYNWQREMTMAGRFVNSFVPPNIPIGCFNAGLVAWHREGTVVNLDGVVNRPAFQALQRGELRAYLRRKGVRFLLDNPAQFEQVGVHANGRHFGGGFDASRDLEEVARFTWPGDRTPRGRPGMEHFGLYRLREEGQLPLLFDFTLDLGPAPGRGRFVQWGASPGAELRVGKTAVLRSDEQVAYVIQVPWEDDSAPLELYAGDAQDPVLVIAPK